MTDTVKAEHYGRIERQLQQDPVVERMAAELRISGDPRADFSHETGTPHHEFMRRCNDYFAVTAEFAGPLHLGAVANAVLGLAYDTSPRQFTLRSTSEDGELCVETVEAVTRSELALRVLTMTAQRMQIAENTLKAQVGDEVLVVLDEHGTEQAAFTLAEFAAR